MSKKQKDENVNVDPETNGQHEAEDTPEINEFDNLSSLIVDCPKGTGRIIPKDKVLHLQSEFEKRGKFAVPRETLDSFLGYSPSKSASRAYLYTRKINTQYTNDDEIRKIKIGIAGDTVYSVDFE